MAGVYITDYIVNPDLEKAILGDGLAHEISEEVSVLLVWHQRIDKKYLDNFPNLKGVVRYGVGFDVVDLDEIKRRGLVFCNTPDYGTDEVSDTAIAMLMSLSRGVHAYDYNSRDYTRGWQENTLKHIRRTSELKVGVIGAGRIGTAFMRKAKAIGFQVVFYDPYLNSGYEKAIGVSRSSSLGELLSESDFLSIHTPLTEETYAMVDSEFIKKMKRGAVLINTARGEIFSDLDAIYEAMIDGQIYAVGLDVLPHEPPEECKLIHAWRDRDPLSSRIIINPHTSYFSVDSYVEMRQKAASNAMRILTDQEPINIILDGRK